MKILLLIGSLVLSLALNLHAQTADTIVMERVFGGYKFHKGDELINMKTMGTIMEPNPFAYSVYKQAHKSYNWAMFFSIAGGALIGWPLGTALAGGEPEWALAGAGAACLVISIPITKKYNKQISSAVQLYNSEFRVTPTSNKSEIKFGATSNGIGLRYSF